jgi:hypothetical protein
MIVISFPNVLWQGNCSILRMDIAQPVYWLFILAIPIACIAWTVTHEEIFSEPRNYCKRQSISGKTLLRRKFFYLFTCEYCFSFYVTALVLLITRYRLLYPDWRGYFVSGFSLIWVANIYMSFFLRIRTELKNDGLDSKLKESELKKSDGAKKSINTLTK